MKYENRIGVEDQFDVMCSEVPVKIIPVWEEVAVEDLRRYHEEELRIQASLKKFKEDNPEGPFPWEPYDEPDEVPEDFEEFLEQMIEGGDLRVVKEA